MRRLLAIALLLAAAAVAVAARGGGEQRYRVDAVFDRTAGLIPGQQVRVAGAPVGEVEDIELTAQRKARVQMVVQEGFAPFRADARCAIRQDALIGEKFVQCNPGTPRARRLRGRAGEVPVVPLERNTAPVEIDLLFSTFRLPYRERLRILLGELGVGLAGRGRELDAAIRRANPALKEVRDVLGVLDRDRRALGRLVEGTDAALAELAGRRQEVQGFIERADAVTQATAGRRDELGEAVRRLPALLGELEPSAERLGAFAREATPAVRDLRAAAPAVNALLAQVGPLSDAAVPALERLGRMARVGRRTVRVAKPVARRLEPAARELPDVVRTATELGESLRDSGGVEGLLTFLYYATTASARFDSVSHIIPTFQVGNDCNPYATRPVAGCSAHFAGARLGTAAAEQGARRRPAGHRPRPRRTAPGPSPERAPREAESRGREVLPGLPLPAPQAPADPGRTGIPLLDYLLGP